MTGCLNLYNRFYSECHETFYTLEEKAETMVDPRLHHNLRKGAKFEAYIFLLIEHIIRMLGLDKILKVTHNPFTYRKYFSRKGRGVDLVIYRKKGYNWIPIISAEIKDWTQRWLSPAQCKSHVINRFNNIIGATRLLICKGIKFGAKTARQLQLNNIKVITNIVEQLKQTIIEKMYNTNMSNSIPLHKTRINEYHIEGSEQYPTPNFTIKRYGSVGYG